MKKFVFSALIAAGSLLTVLPSPASAEPTMILNNNSTAAAVNDNQRVIAWTCTATSRNPATMAVNMTHCDLTYAGTTYHSLEPVVVSGNTVANGFVQIVEAGQPQYTVCQETTAYIPFVGGVTETKCTDHPIG